MTEPGDSAAPIGTAGLDAVSAGAMLRAAREKRGLHIAALAASIKVSPRKLEALEADRHGELPDLTFTRALAQTVCRALKVDAEPVLAKLPRAGDMPRLEQIGGGLNAPYRESAGAHSPGNFGLLHKPVFWATLAVLIAALALAWLPERWVPWRGATAPAASAASAAASLAAPASAPAAESGAVAAVPAAVSAAPPVTSATPVLIEPLQTAAASVPAGSVSATGAGVLALRTSAASWVEVQDAQGQTLLSRSVQPGETVGLDGALPLRLTIGNAAVTQLVFRGRPVDLAASTRDNVARLQLP